MFTGVERMSIKIQPTSNCDERREERRVKRVKVNVFYFLEVFREVQGGGGERSE